MNIIANLHCRMMTNDVGHNLGEFFDAQKLNRDLANKYNIGMKR